MNFDKMATLDLTVSHTFEHKVATIPFTLLMRIQHLTVVSHPQQMQVWRLKSRHQDGRSGYFVPVGLAVFTMVVDTLIYRKYTFDAMMKIDWPVILMFIGLFIWIGGFQSTNFSNRAFKFLRPHMDLYTTQGVFLFTGFVIVGSNILSNIPLVIQIVDQLDKFYCAQEQPRDAYCSTQLVGVLLAWISTIAGNFTLIGSVANLIVAEKARNVVDYRLTFWEYFKFGLCSTLLVLVIGTPIVYFAGAQIHL